MPFEKNLAKVTKRLIVSKTTSSISPANGFCSSGIATAAVDGFSRPLALLSRKFNAKRRVFTPSALRGAPGLALGLLAASSLVVAQTPPDAGVLLDQQRRAAPQAPVAPTAAAPAKAFEGFAAVTGLQPDEHQLLREVEARYKGHTVSAQQVLDLVTRELERRGTTVVLQADAQGRVTAVRPMLSAIEVKDTRAHPRADLRGVLAYGVAIPAPMDRRQVERNATLLNETPGVEASYRMLPGEQPGQTRLLATLQDGRALDAFVSLDNNGNLQVGREQATVGLGLNNRLGWGERLAFNVLKAENGEYLQAAVDVLLHPSGLRGGLNVSRYRYAYFAGNEALLPYDGEASASGAQALLPLDRSEWSRHNLLLALDAKRNAGRANGQPTSDWAVDALSLGLQGQRAMSQGLTAGYSGTLVLGRATQRDAQVAVRDEPFFGQSGDFGKITFQASLTRRLGDSGLTLGVASAGQVASKNLPGSEKFQLGGASALRARAPQLVSGDHALHLEVRLDQPVGQAARVGGFVEAAWLKANTNRVTAAAYQANTADRVHAADAGVRASYDVGNAVFELTLAHPVQGTPRFMNGTPIQAQPADGSRWVGHVRGTVRF